jgi:hypothetical protein
MRETCTYHGWKHIILSGIACAIPDFKATLELSQNCLQSNQVSVHMVEIPSLDAIQMEFRKDPWPSGLKARSTPHTSVVKPPHDVQ